MEDFGKIALKSKHPTQIAARCTVFAESDLVHKIQMGHTKEDVIAGLCQAVAANYLNNVGKGKRILSPIVFQGGVSKNIGIVEAFKKALGCDIIVDSNGHLMGALTDLNTGLSSEQVHERLNCGLSNTVTGSASKTSGKIIRSNIFTYFNLIFFILAAILLYEHSYNNLTFLGVVAANTVIGIVQELRSKKELEKLQLVNEPEVTVIRDAKQKHIPCEELVQDDMVLFAAGNQICADAVICEGTLRVNEALVTGEADEVEKAPGDFLLSGSFVVSGQVKARLTQVGDDSFAAKLSKNARKIKNVSGPA